MQSLPVDEDSTGTASLENNNTETPVKEYVCQSTNQQKAILTEVKTGIQNNEHIQILSGLQEKQQVIVAPYSAIARTLKNDMKVKLVTKKELYQQKETE